jgi:hypothetical protein
MLLYMVQKPYLDFFFSRGTILSAKFNISVNGNKCIKRIFEGTLSILYIDAFIFII